MRRWSKVVSLKEQRTSADIVYGEPQLEPDKHRMP
jgi:hypothetical protein